LKGIKTKDNGIMKSLAKLPSVPESSFPDTEQSIQSQQPVNAPGSKKKIYKSGKQDAVIVYLLVE